MNSAVGGVFTWLLKAFGMDVLVLLRDGLQSQWRRLFASRNVLILGAPQTGNRRSAGPSVPAERR